MSCWKDLILWVICQLLGVFPASPVRLQHPRLKVVRSLSVQSQPVSHNLLSVCLKPSIWRKRSTHNKCRASRDARRLSELPTVNVVYVPISPSVTNKSANVNRAEWQNPSNLDYRFQIHCEVSRSRILP